MGFSSPPPPAAAQLPALHPPGKGGPQSPSKVRSSLLSPGSLYRLPEWSGREACCIPPGQLTGSEGKLHFLLGPWGALYLREAGWVSAQELLGRGGRDTGGRREEEEKGSERKAGMEKRKDRAKGKGGRGGCERKRKRGRGENQRQRVKRRSRKRCEKKTERLRQRPTDRQKPPETRPTRA